MGSKKVPAPAKAEAPTENALLGAKKVDLALVSYLDSQGVTQTQLAVVGENKVHLLEARGMGMSKNTTPQGLAQPWLAEAIIEALKG